HLRLRPPPPARELRAHHEPDWRRPAGRGL
ncbi:MAG: N-carbamoyl-D-amino acid hydrolase, putative, partial [uncultured Microvirga sp.]